MRICLYIPCRNGEATLPEVFAAVRGQTRAPDVFLLVNDQSTDATVALATAAGCRVVHTTPQHSGLSAGRNLAVTVAHEAGCDVIAGIDADAVPAPNYLQFMDSFYAERTDIVGTCGNMRERFADTPADQWRAVFMRQHWGDQSVLNPPILFGSSAAHRVAVLRSMGGFNESLRTNFEDTDLTQRLLHAGHKLAYVPTLVSEHLKRDTPDSVLKMFWGWYLPPADLAGQMRDINTWLAHRLPWIWHDYRGRALGHASMPRLTAITMALPWVQVLRDLHLLAHRAGVAVDLRSIVETAATIHASHGFDKPFIQWLDTRLQFVLAQCGADAGEPLHPQVVEAVRGLASQSIPHRSYWNDLDVSVRELTASAGGPA